MRLRGATALAALAGMALAGCATGEGLEPREVRLRTPEQRVDDLTIDGCARDGDVVVLGASSPAVLVQALLVLVDGEVDAEASGITVTLADRGTLGAGDPDLIDAETGRAGRIERATLRGDRIDVVADAERISTQGSVADGRIELAARCTDEEDLTA